MKSAWWVGLSCVVVLCVCLAGVAPAAAQGYYAQTLFTPDQLDNLVAPVALYPDPLLAQVLIASTYPDEIQSAAQWEQQGYGARDIDDMNWDVSVKAVAHYPRVLATLAQQPDWTTSLGQAYVAEPDDVMDAVQRLRREARAQGNLASNGYQQVLYQGNYIAIDPLQPQYIYVPTYNPAYVYARRGNFISFGAGLAIGAWLDFDFHWANRQVYYTGWQGSGWIARSRPRVTINNVYVNNTYYNQVPVNRAVVDRQPDYSRLNSFRSVHNNVTYTDVAARRRTVAPRVAAANPRTVPAPAVRPSPRNAAPAAPAARATNRAAESGRPAMAARPAPTTRTAPARRAQPSRPAPAQPSAQPSRPTPRTRRAAPARPAPSRPAAQPRRPAPSANPAAPAARPQPSRPAPAPRAPANRAAPARPAPAPHAAPAKPASRGKNSKPPEKPKTCCNL